MTSKRAMAQLLKHLAGAGITHLPKVNLPKPSRILARQQESREEAAISTSAIPETVSTAAESKPLRPAIRPRLASAETEGRRPSQSGTSKEELLSETGPPDRLPDLQAILSRSYVDAEQKTEALCKVATMVAGCSRCTDLASKRTKTVFGVGSPTAEIMFIGEAPGAEEDAKGEPFVGPAGQLLNKIIDASKLKREDIYICNILRCRPPGNRNPLPQEASNCREFLDAQIHIVQPKYIVCWGTVAAQNLLNKTEAVGKLRGQLFDYNGIKVMCTYHPSYLLRNPAAKKQVWEDMKFFMKHLGVELQ